MRLYLLLMSQATLIKAHQHDYQELNKGNDSRYTNMDRQMPMNSIAWTKLQVSNVC